MLSARILWGSFVAAVCIASGNVHAASMLSIGSMATYATGNFGTGETTNIWYIPTYVQYRHDAVRIKLTVPYITVESSGALVSGGAVIARQGSSTSRRIQRGLGDVWLEGKYTFRGERGNLVPYAKVKFATASHAKGLGTGKNDYEVGASLEPFLGTRVFPFITAGYRVVGKPDNATFRNVAVYDAGSSFMLTQKHALTFMYAGRQSAQPAFSASSDIIAAWNYILKSGSGIQVYLDKGLSDGSPDYGVGLGGQISF